MTSDKNSKWGKSNSKSNGFIKKVNSDMYGSSSIEQICQTTQE